MVALAAERVVERVMAAEPVAGAMAARWCHRRRRSRRRAGPSRASATHRTTATQRVVRWEGAGVAWRVMLGGDCFGCTHLVRRGGGGGLRSYAPLRASTCIEALRADCVPS